MNQPAGEHIVLACMPWATTQRPSLALGLLRQLCTELDVPATTLYPNMDLNAVVGFEVAGRFANERQLFGLSEHLFAADLFGAGSLGSDDYLELMGRVELPGELNDPGFLFELRDRIIPKFLDDVTERLAALHPTVVGLTSTFNQVMASLALGKRIKAIDPSVQVVVGGACFDDEMGREYHRALPEVIDHVFLGEAEVSFAEFLDRRKRGLPTNGIPGVTWHDGTSVQEVTGKPLADMNQAPVPDFDDFFAERERLQRTTGLVFNVEYLPFESSRGCWWGQQKHCVFCGINEQLMTYREKSVDRTISEMMYLTSRYRVVKLTAADWIISRKSRKEIFSRLAALDFDVECFFETRADLSKEEIAVMRQAGVVTVQPGIESFSTELLSLMQKGTTRIKHVQFLRWAKEYGIHLSYNILGGFPGESAQWYADMAAFLPTISHLQPPLFTMQYVELHRFSPLFELRDTGVIDQYQLREDYQYNFPSGLVDPLKVGYFFNYQSAQLAERQAYTETVRNVLDGWIERHKAPFPPEYTYKIGPGFVHVTDTRFGDGRYLDLADLHADVVLLCDKIQKLEWLTELLRPLYPAEVGDGTLEHVLEQLVERDVLMREGPFFLTLPVAHRPRTSAELYRYVLGDHAPDVEPDARGVEVAQTGRRRIPVAASPS